MLKDINVIKTEITLLDNQRVCEELGTQDMNLELLQQKEHSYTLKVNTLGVGFNQLEELMKKIRIYWLLRRKV